MPFCYDLSRTTTSNGSANTTSQHLWGTTVTNQETVTILGVFAQAQFNTAGGASLLVKHNTGTIASGGTAQTPAPKNLRGNPAAQSTWKNDATAITAGGTLVQRLSVGFAQTGGMGGYIPIIPQAGIQMMPNGTNPVDLEFSSQAATASVPFTLGVDIGEGI